MTATRAIRSRRSPSVGELNADRSARLYGVVAGEERAYGACDFEVIATGEGEPHVRGAAEPMPSIRGDVARVWFYMSEKYGVQMNPEYRAHLDEVFVKFNGEMHYLWRAVDHEGEVLESYVTKRRDRRAALKFIRKSMKRYGQPHVIVTDKLRSYGAAMKIIGNAEKQETGRWLNNRAENSHLPFRRRERAMQRFRRMRSLQKFVAVHSSVYNLFNQERSLSSRAIFKQNRAATLAEWRGLGAVSARHKGQQLCPCRDWFSSV